MKRRAKLGLSKYERKTVNKSVFVAADHCEKAKDVESQKRCRNAILALAVLLDALPALTPRGIKNAFSVAWSKCSDPDRTSCHEGLMALDRELKAYMKDSIPLNGKKRR